MKIRFEPSNIELAAKEGDRVADLTDDRPDVMVPYGCRAANCGTCRVEVVEGEEAFKEPQEDEAEVLEIFGDEPRVRLCCQLRVAREVPHATLRVIEP